MIQDELDELLHEIESLPDSPPRLALLHRAVEAADARQDLVLGYNLRQILIGTALEIGKGDQLAVAFSWCLAQYDQTPDLFPDEEESILWRFRWVISELSNYPQVPKQQLKSLLDEMTRRYKKAGASLRAVYLLKLNVVKSLWGNRTAESLLKKFQESPRDEYSDDRESELMFEVLHHLYSGREELALKLGKKFLTGQNYGEHERMTLRSAFAVPLVIQGDTKLAMTCHETSIRYAQANPRHVDLISDHMNFLTITDNTKPALKLFAGSLGNAIEWNNPWTRMSFLSSATFLFERLAHTGDKPVKLRLPSCFAHRNAEGVYVPSTLAKLLRADTKAIVDAFNARSGNTYENRQLKNIAKFHQHITPLKLSKSN